MSFAFCAFSRGHHALHLVMPTENPASQISEARKQLPLSLLNDRLCFFSTGSFTGGGEQRVVGFGVVRAKLAAAGGVQFLPEPRRFGVEVLLRHPAQESLAGDFALVGVASRDLLLYEILNRFCHRDFHGHRLA